MNFGRDLKEVKQNNQFSSEFESQNGQETEYLWKIENFSMCPQRKSESIRSSVFPVDSMDESKFRLNLYPRGRDDDEFENVSCYLECLIEADYHVSVDISLIASNGCAFFTKTREDFCMSKGSKTGFVFTSDRQELFSRRALILPHDTLTVRCVIKPVYRATYCCDNDFFALSRDLSNLLNGKVYSDLTLCTSGQAFPVHKFILAARAPNFAREIGLMEDNRIVETASVDTISVSVLQSLLTYLYTGNLDKDLSPTVLNELHDLAKTYGIDDLRRDIFPLEIRTLARTVIKVDWRFIWWNIEDFGKRAANRDWPIRTFFDLTAGKFIIEISMTDDSTSPSIQINIHSKSILVTEDCIFLKCKVLAVKGQSGYNPELCAGEHWFQREEGISNLEFTMTGSADIISDWKRLNQYPDTLQLAFEFSISHPQSDGEIQPEQMTSSLTTPRPALNRSYQRLGADLDLIWKDTCLDLEYNGESPQLHFTDIHFKLKNIAIFSHKGILSARSKVLAEIVALAVSENKEYLDVGEDISKDTLLDLLRYLYAGKIKRRSFEEIKALYVAAVKYEIPSLIRKCSSMLVTKIGIASFCDILIFAEKYEDDEMMSAVVDFMLSQQKDTLGSIDWITLIEKHAVLATKTLIMLSKKLASAL